MAQEETKAGAGAKPGQKSKQDTKEAIRVITRFIEAFNKRDAGTLMDLLSEEHVDHTFFGHKPVSREAVGRAVQGMWQSFPDWYETIEEIVPGPDGMMIVRHTGRGTQAKKYMGRDPNGKQIAAPLITMVRVVDNKIAEYRSEFPFTTPWDETINSGRDIQEARAEQGGFDVDEQQWVSRLQALGEGDLDPGALSAEKLDLPEEGSRCQSLLEENMRRCQNRAIEGSLYCSIHQEPGVLGGYGAS